MIDGESIRTSTVGYGQGQWIPISGGDFLHVDEMISVASEGHCPGCKKSLLVHSLLTWHHRDLQRWGCCDCCGRGWKLEVRDDPQKPYLVATTCREHESWDCDHPLPGGSWTPRGHMQMVQSRVPTR